MFNRPIWILCWLVLVVGFASPIVVSILTHWLKVPIDNYLPGALSLFLLPYVGAAVSSLWVVGRGWGRTSTRDRVAAVLVVAFGPLVGILLSVPVLCIIAQECI
jgi:hypothetical protein